MTSFRDRARVFLEAGALTHAEVEAVALLAPRFGEGDADVLLGLAFVAAAPRLGHVVIDLAEAPTLWSAATLTGAHGDLGARGGHDDEEVAYLPWPSDGAAWHARTLASALVGAERPFVAVPVAGRSALLSTHRRNAEESHVARLVLERTRMPMPAPANLEALLVELFGDAADGEAASAVRLAARQSLAIVTGGPGTGKTFSLTRLLVALARSEDPSQPLVVRLVAPTGKAAARMGEAIAEGLATLPLPEPLRARLASLKAETVHRLVRLRPDGTASHDERNPVQATLVIVDEASMVGLALMRALLRAVPPSARLVLLGDPDQLASVEAGAVLGDMVRADALRHHRVHFTTSRRFASAPTLAACAHALQTPAISQANVTADLARSDDERRRDAVAYLAAERIVDGDPERERLRPLGKARGARGFVDPEQLNELLAPYRERFVPALRALPLNPDDHTLAALLATLDDYRVLAVHRRGPLSVASLEQAFEAELLRGFARPSAGDPRLRHGLPVLITENAPEAGLTNGDVGLVLEIDGSLHSVFPGSEPHSVRRIAPARLPAFEGAFVMTVHKSQGSQFRRVGLVLAGRSSPIQSRELVYTALTRARESVLWVGSTRELDEALRTRVERRSTLAQRFEDS